MRLWRTTLAIATLVACAGLWIVLMPSMAERRWTIEAYHALDSYALADRALQRDLLMARAGLLRNYDPMTADTAEIEGSLARLTRLSARDPALETTVRRLAEDGNARMMLAEQFKSDNALLQNSLARITVTSSSPAASKKASLLAAHVLRLTLDTTPNVVADAKLGIARYEHSPDYADSEEARQLLNHARLLVQLLPAIDQIAASFLAVPVDRDLEQVRLAVNRIDDAINQDLHRRKLALVGITAFALLVFLMLALEVYFHVRSLRRRGDFEHLHATILGLMIDARSRELPERVQRALERLAHHVDADRAYLLLNDARSTSYLWSRCEDFTPAHSRAMVEAAIRQQPWVDDRIQLRSLAALPAEQRAAIAQSGVLPQALILLRSPESEDAVVLGIEADRGPLRIETETMTGLSAALVAILQALHRDKLETERLEFERKLAQGRRMETIGAFASGIAHNVNNIIGAIAGFAETAELHVRGGSPANHNLMEIRSAVGRARMLVDQVLRFGRRAERPHEAVPLGPFVEETARLLGASLPSGIMLRLGDHIPPITLEADAVQLQQVLLNLCHNAASAMPDGGSIRCDIEHIEVHASRRLSHAAIRPGDYVAIAISDEGHGIPASALPRLFDPFFTTRANGTGLGLSTAWEIVQQHGGSIDVRSEIGRGSRFAIWLPLVDKERARAPQPLMRGDGQTILLLNPDPQALERDEELIAALGYEPWGVTTIEDALDDIAACDLLLIVGAERNFLAGALGRLRPGAQGLPYIIAAPIPDDGTETLHYPLRTHELAVALSAVRKGIESGPA
ncbi:DAHL domain-containing protein [Sphingomonas sp. PR090111-T3T-6A]|uniref:DAHL domain-containing protein n=1 Tax=Sphingomonas sp. PR090111-T3T-6A TaxID=685778 RepID=UPI0003662EAB|nr:DAHL domain-containing protein [Sphingomonas sp. PR090111-T3T-6A]